MIRISILAGRRQLDRMNPLGQRRSRRGLLAVALLAFVFAAIAGIPAASADPDPAPVNTTVPTISGPASSDPVESAVYESEPLSADPGAWEGEPTSFSYQWQRCLSSGAYCEPILGATDATYTTAYDPGLGSLGLKLTVTASNDCKDVSVTGAPPSAMP